MSEPNEQSFLRSHKDYMAAAQAAYKTRRDLTSAVAAATFARVAFHEAEAKLAEMHALMLEQHALMLQQIQDAYVWRAAEAAQEPVADSDDSADSADAAPQEPRIVRRRLYVVN